MRTVPVGGVDLAFDVCGEGPATVLVHGMAATAGTWGDLCEVGGLAIAYDRRGYADSTAPEPYTRTTVNEQAEDLAGVIAALDAAPALLVGEDFGALVVLDVLLRHRALARAAVLVDPPLHQFSHEATEALSAERLALEQALRDGGPEEAVARWLGEGADPARVEVARRSARAFFADYGGVATLPLTRGALRGLDLPMGVVTSPSAARAGGEPLLRLAPQVREFGDWREAVAALADCTR
jgi:pimeloyl-ACP methyl ester carboxylesterase